MREQIIIHTLSHPPTSLMPTGKRRQLSSAMFLERRQPDPSYSGTAATAQSFRTAGSRGRGSAYAGARPTCRTQTSDQFELAGAADRFAAVSRRQLSVDVPEMGLYGVDGDVHLASDLGRVQQA